VSALDALLVAVGAGVGAALRYVAGHLLDGRFPWGTLLVNVTGSFLIGLAAGLAPVGDTHTLVAVGFCGGLTTYSAFAVRSHQLGRRLGIAYAVGTTVLALGACAAGFALGAQP
jgi:CrcB protein